MAKTKVNTVASISEGSLSEKQYKDSLEKMQKVFKDMKKVKVAVPKQMRNVVGDTIPVTINGCTIVLPVDGNQYEVPEAFAEVLYGSLQVVQAEDVRPQIEEQQRQARKARGDE